MRILRFDGVPSLFYICRIPSEWFRSSSFQSEETKGYLQVAKPFEGVEGLREVGYLDPDFFVFGSMMAQVPSTLR